FSGSANEPPANAFVSDNNFSTVFGNSNPTGFDVLGDVLKPTNDQFANPTNVFGLPQDPVADANAPPAQNTASSGKIITGDLDSSLMSL
uniref:Uncharacterized protein n=1 Tax=Megaselia scalaris TaxID=36166 RepID=T1H1A5_MEGSC